VSDSEFSHSFDQLRQIARDVLEHAKSKGASAAETEVSEAFGQSVTVRQGAVETIEYNRDKGVGVTVYLDRQRGHASTSDFTPKAVRETVEAALSIARFTASDEAAGLADEALLARGIADLDLYHPWSLTVESAIELARECEAAALAVDPRITNSEGASVSTQQSHFAYGNTLGFLSGYPSSRHTVMCSVIAGEGDGMQRDDWYAQARAAEDLDDVRIVGRQAGQR
jgi:PmbA protein